MVLSNLGRVIRRRPGNQSIYVTVGAIGVVEVNVTSLSAAVNVSSVSV